MRRLLAWFVALALVAIAAGGAIYLGMPKQAAGWKVEQAKSGEAVKARAAGTEEGTAEIEVERGGEVRKLKVRQVGKDTVIEQAPLEPVKKPWWRRR